MSEKVDVLIVDDQQSIREMLSLQLQSAGYQVLPAADADDGYALALQTRPEIIIADLVMLPCNGIEFCRRIRTHPVLRQVYFILLTGHDGENRDVLALNSGADEYLTKPWQQDVLIARVRTGMRLRLLQKEIAEAHYHQALLELAVTLAHEINNPLTALNGNLTLLKEGLDPKNQGNLLHYADQVASQSERISQVVKRLMNLSKPNRKLYHNEQKMVDLGLPRTQAEVQAEKPVDLSSPIST